MTSLRHMAVACLVVAACSRRGREGACHTNSDCPNGRACVSGRCAPRTSPPTAAAPQPPPSSAPPAPAPAADAGASDVPLVQPPPGLAAGSYRCSFTEDGHDYDRECTVTDTGGGGFRVAARGTRLNPGQGFTFEASGAAPVYGARGSLTAFAGCNGAFSGALTRDGTSEPPVYKIRWGNGCAITLRL